MNVLPDPLNKDQLTGLSNLFFDLAKGAFAFIFFPSVTINQNPLLSLVQILFSIMAGLAFTYEALLLLRKKEEVSK